MNRNILYENSVLSSHIYIYKTKNFQPVYLDEPNSDNNQKLWQFRIGAGAGFTF